MVKRTMENGLDEVRGPGKQGESGVRADPSAGAVYRILMVGGNGKAKTGRPLEEEMAVNESAFPLSPKCHWNETKVPSGLRTMC